MGEKQVTFWGFKVFEFGGRLFNLLGFPGGSVVKNLPAKQEMQLHSLSWEDLLEEEIGTHSSILAEEIPWTEPGGL